MTFGKASRGESGGPGSGSKTSSTAVRSLRRRSTSIISSCRTMPPLAVLIRWRPLSWGKVPSLHHALRLRFVRRVQRNDVSPANVLQRASLDAERAAFAGQKGIKDDAAEVEGFEQLITLRAIMPQPISATVDAKSAGHVTGVIPQPCRP